MLFYPFFFPDFKTPHFSPLPNSFHSPQHHNHNHFFPSISKPSSNTAYPPIVPSLLSQPALKMATNTNPTLPLEFGSYDNQVGGHGQTDDTGLLSLFNNQAICKPVNVDKRGFVESFYYRDLLIAIATMDQKRLDFDDKLTLKSSSSSPLPSPHTTTVKSETNDEIHTTTTHFGWFSIDHVPQWAQWDQFNYQEHFFNTLTPLQFSLLRNNSTKSTPNLSQTLLQPILHRILTYQLPINPSPPENYKIQALTIQKQCYLSWYYRSLLAKINIYPTPLGNIVKHIISSTNTPCYPLNPYDSLHSNQLPQNDPALPPNTHIVKPYLVLESLTARYTYPAVVDIKIGQMSWNFNADYLKMNYEVFKGPVQQEVGFRLTGANVPFVHSNGINVSGDVDAAIKVSMLKMDRQIGQKEMNLVKIVGHFVQIFTAFLLPINPPSESDVYSRLSLEQYAQLRIDRVQLVQDLLLCMIQQLQEIILLEFLYPTHHITASSILVTYEAHPDKCANLVHVWKTRKLEQYRQYQTSLGKQTDSQNDSINWDIVLNTTNELYLRSIIDRYYTDLEWFKNTTNTDFLIEDQNQSLIQKSNFFIPYDTNPSDPIPLPIVLKHIDCAHAFEPIEFKKVYSKWSSSIATKYTQVPAKQIWPGFIPLPADTPSTADATVYRHEFTANNYIYINNEKHLEQTGILQCSDCSLSSPLSVPGVLPRPYEFIEEAIEGLDCRENQSSVVLPPELTKNISPDYPTSIQSHSVLSKIYLKYLDINSRSQPHTTSVLRNPFIAPDIGWSLSHVCEKHRQFILTRNLLDSYTGNVSNSNQTRHGGLPIVQLLPLSIIQSLGNIQSKKESRNNFETHLGDLHDGDVNKNDILFQFEQDHARLNAIKNILGIVMHISRHLVSDNRE